MRFRTIVVAAVILVLAISGMFAVFMIADQAREEADQQTIERSDQLAITSGIVQSLVSDDDHTPTRYGDTIDVTHNGTTFNESEQYAYAPENGTIEFLIDEDSPANISYEYQIPADQVADDQIQTLTVSTGLILRVAVGLTFVVVFLFVGAFAAKRLSTSSTNSRRGR